MKFKVWRTTLAWMWFCPHCERSWRETHSPPSVAVNTLAPDDRRRIPAFRRTIDAVWEHIDFHQQELFVRLNGCTVPMIGGPLNGRKVRIPAAHPALLPRIPVDCGAASYCYDAAYTPEGRWVYRVGEPIPARKVDS